jgi:hypothetical protein
MPGGLRRWHHEPRKAREAPCLSVATPWLDWGRAGESPTAYAVGWILLPLRGSYVSDLSAALLRKSAEGTTDVAAGQRPASRAVGYGPGDARK